MEDRPTPSPGSHRSSDEAARDPSAPEHAAPSNLPSLRELVEAFGALTPLRLPGRGEPVSPGRAALFYPLVGLALGGALVGIDRVAIGLAAPLRSVLLLAALTVLSRGGPLRGFARTCRAAAAGANRARALAQLRAPSFGAVAWVAGALLLAAEGAGILAMSRYRLYGLLFAPLLSRWSMVVVAFSARAARLGGAGPRYMPDLTFREFALASVFTFAVTFSATEAFGILIVVIVAAITVALRLIWHRWLGGVDDATAGATAAVAELLVLVCFGWLGG